MNMRKYILALAAALMSIGAAAQNHLFSGTVRDTQGQPVIGAYVHVPETRNGTVTDVDGRYQLTAGTGQVLEVTCMGYKTFVTKVPSGARLDISLEEDNQVLEETVVVGYGIQKRINLTGAVATISSEAIQDRPVTNALRALQGADPSLNIIIGSGNPSEGQNINIRGVSSVNSASPLVLVDGVPDVGLHQINANDIESISILKDASAAAIYGAKASAGVIIVTTKSGSKGKAKVNYNFNSGVTQPTTKTDFITSGYDYVTLINPIYYSRYGYNAFYYDDAQMAELEARRYDKTENPARPWVVVDDSGKYHYYGNFDWYHNLFNTNRLHQEHNLSVTGGDKNLNYYISGRYYDQDGTLSGPIEAVKEKFRSYSFRSKVTAQVKPWARWTANAAITSNYQIYPGVTNEALTIAGFDQNLSPTMVPTNPDGSMVMYPADMRGVSLGTGRTVEIQNPNNRHVISANRMTLGNNLNFKLLEGLTLDANYNLNFYHRIYKDRNHPDVYSSTIGTFQTTTNYSSDNYRERIYDYLIHNINAYLTYSRTFAKDHHFTAVAGTDFESYRLVDNILTQNFLGNEALSSFNSVTDDSIQKIEQDISAYKTQGFFARVNYDYRGRYLFEASFRADQSSRFAPGHRWGYFPSMSLGWRFSEESFFEPLKGFWNNGKLRFSYGALGNQQVSNYQWQQTIDSSNLSYLFDTNGVVKSTSVSAPNADDLTWETVITWNLGLDLAFLNNRLTFTGDAFIRDTKNMLTAGMTLPSVYGASNPKSNAADMRTTGWEIALTWKDTIKLGGDSFFYSVTGTLGDYVRTITRFNNPSKLFSQNYEGKKLGEIWGYHVPGLFQSDEEAAAYEQWVHRSANVYQRIYNMSPAGNGYLMAGDVKFDDRNGDGYINNGSGTVDDPGDMMIIGNNSPRYSYGLKFDISWKGFDISAFFQGVGKRDWYPTANSDAIYGANLFWQLYTYPIPTFVQENFTDMCWTPENTDGYFPKIRPIICYNGGPLGQNNDRYLQNVAYLRFKNFTLGYTIPFKSKSINKARVYASGENLWYWSPLKRYCTTIDPELAVSTTTYKSGTGSGYQMPRTFSVGLDLTF